MSSTNHPDDFKPRYTRSDMTIDLQEAKRSSGLTYDEIAKKVGRSEVFIAAAMHGQHTLSEEEADKLLEVLKIHDQQRMKRILTEPPMRAQEVEIPPRDPTLYRFYEALLVYGPAWKALIHEKFGDGIMSAIDFQCDLKKEGERVKIVLDGKFLPYKKF